MELLKRLFNEEDGQGLVEYALIIALIAVAFIAFGDSLGDAIGEQFEKITESVTTPTP